MAFKSGSIVKNLVIVYGEVVEYNPQLTNQEPTKNPGKSGPPGLRIGETVEISPGFTGEVLSSDDLTTVALYPIHHGGELEPRLIKVMDFTASFKSVVRQHPFVWVPGGQRDLKNPGRPMTSSSEYLRQRALLKWAISQIEQRVEGTLISRPPAKVWTIDIPKEWEGIRNGLIKEDNGEGKLVNLYKSILLQLADEHDGEPEEKNNYTDEEGIGQEITRADRHQRMLHKWKPITSSWVTLDKWSVEYVPPTYDEIQKQLSEEKKQKLMQEYEPEFKTYTPSPVIRNHRGDKTDEEQMQEWIERDPEGDELEVSLDTPADVVYFLSDWENNRLFNWLDTPHDPWSIQKDWDSLFARLTKHDNFNGDWVDSSEINALYQLARKLGEIPAFAKAATDWTEEVQDEFYKYYDASEAYPGEPEDWDEEAQGNWYESEEFEKGQQETDDYYIGQSPMMQAAAEVWKLINPHWMGGAGFINPKIPASEWKRASGFADNPQIKHFPENSSAYQIPEVNEMLLEAYHYFTLGNTEALARVQAKAEPILAPLIEEYRQSFLQGVADKSDYKEWARVHEATNYHAALRYLVEGKEKDAMDYIQMASPEVAIKINSIYKGVDYDGLGLTKDGDYFRDFDGNIINQGDADIAATEQRLRDKAKLAPRDKDDRLKWTHTSATDKQKEKATKAMENFSLGIKELNSANYALAGPGREGWAMLSRARAYFVMAQAAFKQGGKQANSIAQIVDFVERYIETKGGGSYHYNEDLGEDEYVDELSLDDISEAATEIWEIVQDYLDKNVFYDEVIQQQRKENIHNQWDVDTRPPEERGRLKWSRDESFVDEIERLILSGNLNDLWDYLKSIQSKIVPSDYFNMVAVIRVFEKTRRPSLALGMLDSYRDLGEIVTDQNYRRRKRLEETDADVRDEDSGRLKWSGFSLLDPSDNEPEEKPEDNMGYDNRWASTYKRQDPNWEEKYTGRQILDMLIFARQAAINIVKELGLPLTLISKSVDTAMIQHYWFVHNVPGKNHLGESFNHSLENQIYGNLYSYVKEGLIPEQEVRDIAISIAGTTPAHHEFDNTRQMYTDSEGKGIEQTRREHNENINKKWDVGDRDDEGKLKWSHQNLPEDINYLMNIYARLIKGTIDFETAINKIGLVALGQLPFTNSQFWKYTSYTREAIRKLPSLRESIAEKPDEYREELIRVFDTHVWPQLQDSEFAEDIPLTRHERPTNQPKDIRKKWNVGERDENDRLKWSSEYSISPRHELHITEADLNELQDTMKWAGEESRLIWQQPHDKARLRSEAIYNTAQAEVIVMVHNLMNKLSGQVDDADRALIKILTRILRDVSRNYYDDFAELQLWMVEHKGSYLPDEQSDIEKYDANLNLKRKKEIRKEWGVDIRPPNARRGEGLEWRESSIKQAKIDIVPSVNEDVYNIVWNGKSIATLDAWLEPKGRGTYISYLVVKDKAPKNILISILRAIEQKFPAPFRTNFENSQLLRMIQKIAPEALSDKSTFKGYDSNKEFGIGQVPIQDFSNEMLGTGMMDPSERNLRRLRPRKSAYKQDDPLDTPGLRAVIEEQEVQWWKMPRAAQEQAVANALRVGMLSPLKLLKFNAVHYQDISKIPGDESDPQVYIDQLKEMKSRWDARGQTNLFNDPEEVDPHDPENSEAYAGFIHQHLGYIANASAHIGELTDAAEADIKNGGEGYIWRESINNINLPGVNSKVASFAWLLLAPKTSELVTIDSHMLRALDADPAMAQTPKGYQQLEDEIKTAKDASGYNHMPAGMYQWGLWDYMRTPPDDDGYHHQSHAAMRVLNPLPYKEVKWHKAINNSPIYGERPERDDLDWWHQTAAQRMKSRAEYELLNKKRPVSPPIQPEITEQTLFA